MYDLIPLQMLPAGETAQVVELLGDSLHLHRLSELGLRQGVTVQMVRPGEPCIIRLAGTKLCLRPDEFSTVLVKAG